MKNKDHLEFLNLPYKGHLEFVKIPYNRDKNSYIFKIYNANKP